MCFFASSFGLTRPDQHRDERRSRSVKNQYRPFGPGKRGKYSEASGPPNWVKRPGSRSLSSTGPRDPAVLYRRFCNRSAENQKLVPLRCSRRCSVVRTRSASPSSRSSARRSSRFSAWVSFGSSAMISLSVILGSRFVSFGYLNRKYRTIPVASIITNTQTASAYPLHSFVLGLLRAVVGAD